MSGGVVYCAEMADVAIIKIGFTTQLDKRLKTIWQDAPFRRLGVEYPAVTLVRTFTVERRFDRLESALHYHFRGHRLSREWFCGHGIKATLLGLSDEDLPGIQRQYWETYPSNTRPQEFQGPPTQCYTRGPRFTETQCYQHRQCRRAHDWDAHMRARNIDVFHILQGTVEF